MAIANQAALIVIVKNLMGTSFDKISDNGFINAATQTELELPWSYPISVSGQEFWMVERCRRHAIYILMVESAAKFQYKLVRLQHRFQNYIKLIENMDALFYKAIEDDPMEIFEDLASSFSDFGYLITNGFVYDNLGRDCTYLNERVILP